MKWFRFYQEFMDDPKIAMMSDSDQLLWVKALCLASDSTIRGIILLTDEEICWKLRITVETWKHAIDKFRAKGMIQHNTDGPGYVISNWDKRQFESDSSAERVRKHRAAKAGKPKPKPGAPPKTATETTGDKPCNVTVTPSEQTISEQTIPIPDPDGQAEGKVLGPARSTVPAIASQPMLVDRFAAQFAPKPWRDEKGTIPEPFCKYVGNLFPDRDSPDGGKHAVPKGRNHIINLEKSGDPYDREKLMGYLTDWQSLSAITPNQSANKIAELARQSIAQERAS